MEEASLRVTLTEPGVAGDYIVVEHNPDGTVLLAPDTPLPPWSAASGSSR